MYTAMIIAAIVTLWIILTLFKALSRTLKQSSLDSLNCSHIIVNGANFDTNHYSEVV